VPNLPRFVQIQAPLMGWAGSISSSSPRALREIRRYQKSTELLIRKFPFQRQLLSLQILSSNSSNVPF
jgi:hypothetical protein